MNRGAARQRIFLTKHDARQFLALVGEASERFGNEVHAYCLMTNHYHLLVRCPSGELSEFMHLVGSHYVRYFNSRLDRDGPMFRGRFHAILLDSSDYVHHVGRYIHRNPLDVRPHVALDEYEWSSFRYYAQDRPHPRWLRMDELLSVHGTRADYRAFVDSEARAGRGLAFSWAVETAVDELVDDASLRTNIRRTVAVALLDVVDPRDQPTLERWLAFPTPAARTQALRRMRERRATSPLVAEIAARAIALAA
jgi:REP element-mobilizing transposase RayT